MLRYSEAVHAAYHDPMKLHAQYEEEDKQLVDMKR